MSFLLLARRNSFFLRFPIKKASNQTIGYSMQLLNAYINDYTD